MYIKKLWKLLIQSFLSLNRDSAKTALYDLLFYGLIILIAYILNPVLNQILQLLQGIRMDNLSLVDVTILQSNASLFRSFFVSLVIFAFSCILVFSVLYSLTNAIIWLTIKKQEISSKNILNFTKYVFPWTFLLLIACLCTLLIIEPAKSGFFFIAFILLFIYFNQSLFMTIIKKKRAIIKTALRNAFFFFPNLVVPFCLAGLFLALLMFLLGFIDPYFPFISFIMASTLVASWFRPFLFKVYKEAAK